MQYRQVLGESTDLWPSPPADSEQVLGLLKAEQRKNALKAGLITLLPEDKLRIRYAILQVKRAAVKSV